MKNSLSNKLKFIKLLEEIHKLKVDTLNNSRYETRVNNIDERANHLYEMFLKGALSDKEKAIFNQVKEEKVAQKVRQSYKKKINKVQQQLNNTISPEERRKVGYLKYRSRIDIKVQKKLKEKFGDKIFSNIKKGTKDSMLANNKIILDELK
jgi:hypothetical protein